MQLSSSQDSDLVMWPSALIMWHCAYLIETLYFLHICRTSLKHQSVRFLELYKWTTSLRSLSWALGLNGLIKEHNNKGLKATEFESIVEVLKLNWIQSYQNQLYCQICLHHKLHRMTVTRHFYIFIWSAYYSWFACSLPCVLQFYVWPCLCLDSVHGYLVCTAHWSTVVVFSCAL